MVDDVALRTAVETAWSVFCATHDGVDAADSRRCLLERHLQGMLEAREEEEKANYREIDDAEDEGKEDV